MIYLFSERRKQHEQERRKKTWGRKNEKESKKLA
jgi:hypothetical protein